MGLQRETESQQPQQRAVCGRGWVSSGRRRDPRTSEEEPRKSCIRDHRGEHHVREVREAEVREKTPPLGKCSGWRR